MKAKESDTDNVIDFLISGMEMSMSATARGDQLSLQKLPPIGFSTAVIRSRTLPSLLDGWDCMSYCPTLLSHISSSPPFTDSNAKKAVWGSEEEKPPSD